MKQREHIQLGFTVTEWYGKLSAEHLSLLIEALQQAGVTLPPNALERSLHLLKLCSSIVAQVCFYTGVIVCLLLSPSLTPCISNSSIFASASR